MLVLLGMGICFLLNRCSSPATNTKKFVDDDSTLSLDSILNDVKASYKDTVKVDTTFMSVHGDTVNIRFMHYCTYDKKIDLPQRYIHLYKLRKFQTHNFISSLDFRINSKVIFSGFITKDDFKPWLNDGLKEYGVLSFPVFDVSGTHISVEYSISIPLTDVGKGLVMQMDSTGKKITGPQD